MNPKRPSVEKAVSNQELTLRGGYDQYLETCALGAAGNPPAVGDGPRWKRDPTGMR